ncbi:Homocysteine S-methyltransferase 1 [Aphelenchoides bicaudatus]|nr:Homocysteine S-methyltransferase 1 [Aphelenchoides bicaudatus]
MSETTNKFGNLDLRCVHVAIGGVGAAIGSLGYDLNSAHSNFIESGADLIITNTYQANIKRLSEKMSADEALKYVTSAVDLAQTAIQNAKRPIELVGCVGPYATYLIDGSEYNGSYMKNKDFDRELIRQNYQTQATTLYSKGIRLFSFETIPSLEETFYAKGVLEEIGCDGWVSVICKDSEHLVNGDKFADVVRSLASSPNVKAIGINCTSPVYIKGLLKKGAPNLKDKCFVVYPNSGEHFDK